MVDSCDSTAALAQASGLRDQPIASACDEAPVPQGWQLNEDGWLRKQIRCCEFDVEQKPGRLSAPWLHQCARGTHQPPPITVRPVAADGGTAIRGRSVVDEETFAGFCILRAADESLAGRSEEGVVVYGCEARVLARLPFR